MNGTLEGEERELVGRQVLASLTCRKELERLRRLQQLIQRDDAEAAATGRAFERLMARIHASGDSIRIARTTPADGRSPGLSSPSPPRWPRPFRSLLWWWDCTLLRTRPTPTKR